MCPERQAQLSSMSSYAEMHRGDFDNDVIYLFDLSTEQLDAVNLPNSRQRPML